jgi:hypothetical protein
MDAITQISASVGPFIDSVLTMLSNWFTENGPLIGEFVQLFVTGWNERILPTLIMVWERIQPILLNLLDVILNIGTLIMAVATGDWATAWNAIKEIVGSAWDAITGTVVLALDLLAHNMGTSLDEIKTQWLGNLDQLKSIVMQVFTIISSFIMQKLAEVRALLLSPFNLEIFHQVAGAIMGIATAIYNVLDAVGAMAIAFANLTLPDWLTPGSPTPLENGLVGIKDALAGVSSTPFPSFATQSPLSGAGAAGGRSGGSGIVLNFTYSPAVAFGSEREMRDKISPVLVELLREAQSNGVI